ncbi:MAG: methionine ABC transporter ATP-binding protein [Propionibacteriaceae bacterium]|nr:methionine ABC transporter ATP-binding protein [Propionibacteriaceae bacterium]
MTDSPEAAAGQAPIISFVHAKKYFQSKRKTVKAVDDVSLDIRPGEIFGVIGYSGAGKSTLVRLINVLESVDSGDVIVEGINVTGLKERDLRTLRTHIGMIFQQFNLFSAKTVAENVGYPLKLAGWTKERVTARVDQMLEFVGISDKAGAYPSHLSGGQKQRVGIARALAHSPAILLADEATSALDPETTADVLALLKKANEELGITIVVITHEMGVVQNICDRVAVMEEGKIVEHGDTYTVFAHPKRSVTKRFIQTALHSRPSRDTVNRLHEVHPGRLVLMTVTASMLNSEKFNLAKIADKHKVISSIIYGSITEVGSRPLGNVVVEMTSPLPLGVEAEFAIDGLLEKLSADGIKVTDLGTSIDPKDDPTWVELASVALAEEAATDRKGADR